MNFTFNKDQEDLIAGARDFLIGEVSIGRLRAIMREETVEPLWPQLCELGLVGIMAPEDQGGLAQPLEVMVAIAEAAGYVGLPDPLVEVAGISIPVAQAHGAHPEVAAMVAGAATHFIAAHTRPYVPKLEGCQIVNLENSQYKIMPIPSGDEITSIDPLRQLVKVPHDNTDSVCAWHGSVLSAAQLIGLSHRMVDMSVAYASDRRQFGQAIGAFQGVKHQLASVHTQIEFARPIIWQAAKLGGRAVHAAKIAAIDTAMQAGETAIQVFGGMGYTFEVDLHLFMKRCWALIGEWGDRHYHARALDQYLLADHAALGPGTSFTASAV